MNDNIRKVRVMINPNSGPYQFMGRLYKALETYWNVPGIDLTYQISRSAEDGREKARRAVADNVDTIIVVGGDGMVNSIGPELIDSNTALAVIPAGSGNGFARHFNIPLGIDAAAASLREAHRRMIDVGMLNGVPFFVTASMAWDAALMKVFERMPMRGIFPYVFSAVYEYFDYRPQPVVLEFDDGEVMRLEDPMVLTAANMTEYGFGARIAPGAEPDDGLLELVYIPRNTPTVLSNIYRLFEGKIDQTKDVITRKFSRLVVKRPQPSPIQMDGEVRDGPAEIKLSVRKRALNVIVPVN